MVQGSCTPFTQRQSVGEVGARLGQGGRRYAQDKRSQTDRRMEGRADRLIFIERPRSLKNQHTRTW